MDRERAGLESTMADSIERTGFDGFKRVAIDCRRFQGSWKELDLKKRDNKLLVDNKQLASAARVGR